jgi:peptide/nickel transport system permease protein
MLFIALFGDFIANEKPLYCRLDGKTYFPVLKQYAVAVGLNKWEARFIQNDWKSHNYQLVVYPLIPYSSNTLDLKNGNYKSPFAKQKIESWRWRHWLGTDRLGRDVLAGLIAGTRVALLVGLIAMAVASFIGIGLGAVAGFFGDNSLQTTHLKFWMVLFALPFAWFYTFGISHNLVSESSGIKVWITNLALFGLFLALVCLLATMIERIARKIGWRMVLKQFTIPADLIIMRVIEVFNSIPTLLLLLSFVAILEKSSVFYVMLLIGLVRWTSIARFIRAEMLKIRKMPYIEAALALGFSKGWILLRHALPNALGPVIITISFGIASSILLESTLSFLGIGIADNTATWGTLLSEARRYPGAWWLALFPGIAIFIAVTVFNFIGEGLDSVPESRRE